jgi:hypothetical protein
VGLPGGGSESKITEEIIGIIVLGISEKREMGSYLKPYGIHRATLWRWLKEPPEPQYVGGLWQRLRDAVREARRLPEPTAIPKLLKPPNQKKQRSQDVLIVGRGMGFVYAICSPTGRRIMYIGSTRQTIRLRLQGHYDHHSPVGRWLRSLLARGKRPHVRILREEPFGRLKDSEKELVLAHQPPLNRQWIVTRKVRRRRDVKSDGGGQLKLF